ncbi:MAG: DMT family transporter [Hyphomicrobiales bacterium]
MTSAVHSPPRGLSHSRGILLVLLAGVFWSSIGLVIRLMDGAGAWQILFYRSLSLTVFLFAVLAIRSGGWPGRVFREAGSTGVLGGIALVAAFAGSIMSILGTTVANAMFLFASAPFFAAVLGWALLGERVRRATWIAIAIAAAGILLMVTEAISFGHVWGNAAAVMSALGFAFFTIALRRGHTTDMLPVVCYGGLFATVLAAIVCLATGDGLAVSGKDASLALTLGIVQLGTGLSIYTIGSRVVPAAELALLSMTEVVLGPFWVWAFLGETAGTYTLLGGAILLAAIAGNALSGLRRRPPPAGMR